MRQDSGLPFGPRQAVAGDLDECIGVLPATYDQPLEKAAFCCA